MGQEHVVTVEDMSDGIELMLPKLDFGVDAAEGDVPPVVLAGPGGVVEVVVLADKGLPPVGVFPNPVPESVLDGLLLLLGQSGFIPVENTALLAVRVGDGVVDAHVTEV